MHDLSQLQSTLPFSRLKLVLPFSLLCPLSTHPNPLVSLLLSPLFVLLLSVLRCLTLTLQLAVRNKLYSCRWLSLASDTHNIPGLLISTNIIPKDPTNISRRSTQKHYLNQDSGISTQDDILFSRGLNRQQVLCNFLFSVVFVCLIRYSAAHASRNAYGIVLPVYCITFPISWRLRNGLDPLQG